MIPKRTQLFCTCKYTRHELACVSLERSGRRSWREIFSSFCWSQKNSTSWPCVLLPGRTLQKIFEGKYGPPLPNTSINAIIFPAEIDFFADLRQNFSIGLQRDDDEMVYCYQKKNLKTNGHLKTTSHIRDHFYGEMMHASFILTAQIKIKELRGLKQRIKTN